MAQQRILKLIEMPDHTPENPSLNETHIAKHNLIAEIYGTTAIEIVNTIIKNKYISSLQHAADMGIELCKAELALKYDLKYIQDKDLLLK